MKQVITIISFLLSFTALFSVPVNATEGVLSDEALNCLGCHGSRGIVKKFKNNESVAAYVNPERFMTSAHNRLTCSICHTDFSDHKHPKRTFKSKEQYKIRSSLVCRRCHTFEQLKRKPVHENLIRNYSQGIPFVCTGCHDSHSTLPVRGGKILTKEKEHCLSCHTGRLQLVFQNGEILPLEVEPSSLQTSVHHGLGCSDCHLEFSTKDHPKRNFRTKREFVIANSESCRRCHFDKYSRTKDSVHYILLSQGNLQTPVCTDCHGSHSVREGKVEKILSGKRCKQCHNDVYQIYAQSVHGKALIDGQNQDVAICVDCHKAHDIRNPRAEEYREIMPKICGDCHANKEIVGKYGLSTDVVKTYLSDFHGVTLELYRKQKERGCKPGEPIAICTDCHGTHNITKTIEPDATIMKANLVKRCRKCHPDASENFPNAWLPHYEPSMNKAPLIFIINWVYKILMPVMIAGLLLHILLHIWRYGIKR